MRRIITLATCFVLLGAAAAQAEYIATINGARESYADNLDKIVFSIDEITANSKVITMEGTWTALGNDSRIFINEYPDPDWIYETNRTVRNDDPLSYCNFQYSNDAAGTVWTRTDDETNYSDLLTGGWYTSNESYKLGLGSTLAVMYVTKDAGVSFIGKMTVSETAVGSTTNAYEFSVAPIPEPSTLALLACGLAGLLAYAWRKRK